MSDPQKHLTPYMSPAEAWAFALGASIGWGSLVITGNTCLSQAGPVGSIFGLLIGAAIMLVIAGNYFYMIRCCPDAGGVYAYAKEAFGYDHAFLCAWFLALTYLAVFWANATSLPLFARYFLGGVFHVIYCYSLFGYEVYLGEALLSIAAILLVAVLCARRKKIPAVLMAALAVFFVVGITVCFAAALIRHGASFSFRPLTVPGKNDVAQVIGIACISPWAFIGFENISHSAEEYTFPHRKVFRVLAAAILSATLLYIFVTLLSVTAYPPEYGSWLAYIRDLDNLSGVKGLPAFYAARFYLGNFGLWLLLFSLLALIVTSLIGNLIALSRLFYALARDRVLPRRFSNLNRRGIPEKAVWLIAAVSLLIPFLGRTAIGWIVDVTTLGATIVYGFVSAAALKTAKRQGDNAEKWTGFVGLVLMAGFLLYLLIPNLFSSGSMATESYFLFTIWAILGFVFFRGLMKRDETHRFGNSIIVWIALLSLVLFTSLIWMSQTMIAATGDAMSRVQDYYVAKFGSADAAAFVAGEISALRHTIARSMLIVIVLFGFSVMTLLNIYSLMRKRAEESEAELGSVRHMANTDPLTGVKSKHAYVEAETALNGEIQGSAAEPFAVVVCDVNGLKQVNDTLGHKAGDEYIRSAAVLICELFQHSPVFRVGGDEFVAILRGRDYDDRRDIMAKLGRKAEANIGLGEVVVAAGISDYAAGDDRTIRDVFDRADALMYRRKKELKAMGSVSR
ncbi:MAG: amino acid permease [Bacillota bacterium]|jgi:diguanylate cyclase (GGDEF)-like protein